MSGDFLPSQVVLSGIPLTGTMGRTEREVAAAYLVLACQFHGDRWQPVTPLMIRAALDDADAKEGHVMSGIARNPFARPDFFGLTTEGFATQDQGPGPAPIELTPKAFEAMRKWVRS